MPEGFKVTKSVTETISFGFALLDLHSYVLVGMFNKGQKGGLLEPSTIPADCLASIPCRSNEVVRIKNVALALDPLVHDPKWDRETTQEALASYTSCMSALYAGVFRVDSPFPATIPVSQLNLVRYAPLPSSGVLAPLWEGREAVYDWGTIPAMQEAEVSLTVPSRKLKSTHEWIWPGVISVAIEKEALLATKNEAGWKIEVPLPRGPRKDSL